MLGYCFKIFSALVKKKNSWYKISAKEKPINVHESFHLMKENVGFKLICKPALAVINYQTFSGSSRLRKLSYDIIAITAMPQVCLLPGLTNNKTIQKSISEVTSLGQTTVRLERLKITHSLMMH